MGVLILAGCGGSSAPKQQTQAVQGPGFRFEAPAGWSLARSTRRVSATHDSQLVQVATFPLVKPYTPSLFGRVAAELQTRMAAVARQSHGTVTATHTVTADGIRSHSYEVSVGDHVDVYTFVLAGMHEFQLLCRRNAAGESSFCSALVTSFARA